MQIFPYQVLLTQRYIFYGVLFLHRLFIKTNIRFPKRKRSHDNDPPFFQTPHPYSAVRTALAKKDLIGVRKGLIILVVAPNIWITAAENSLVIAAILQSSRAARSRVRRFLYLLDSNQPEEE